MKIANIITPAALLSLALIAGCSGNASQNQQPNTQTPGSSTQQAPTPTTQQAPATTTQQTPPPR